MAHVNLPNLRGLQDSIALADRALRGEGDAEAARIALAAASAILSAAADGVAPPELRAEAVRQYGSEDVEIDDDPATSEAEGGVWVSAWVWIPGPDDDEEDSEECATCAEAVETRAAPCDECGAMDGEA